MASLKDIRRRIGSVKNTQQITKAMKMVSASKLRRAQQAIGSARPYSQKLEDLASRILIEIQSAAGKIEESKRIQFLQNLHPLLKQTPKAEGESPKTALVVVTSDRGLCGAYNTNMLRFALREHRALKEAGHEVYCFFVGRRGSESLKRRGLNGEIVPDMWAGKFTTSKADKLTQVLTEQFLSGRFDSVQVLFTQFKSALTQTATRKQLLPLEVIVPSGDIGTVPSEAAASPFKYEPQRSDLLATLLPGLVKTSMYRMLADSLASEFGSRMTAMDSATRNAGQMISRLTLEANRVRQASITKELMEIVGGAEALKG